MLQSRNYNTKKTGKTEVHPFWNLEDINKIIEYYKNKSDYDNYLIFMLGLLLGRRIGDTIMVKWSDFFYENGNRKEEIDTIEEQKTGKTTTLPVSTFVFECIDYYCCMKNINPMEHLNEYVFNNPSKRAWQERENSPIYKEQNIYTICSQLNKDFSDKRVESILKGFKKQNYYKTIGEYFYYEIEFSDIIKWQTDNFRKNLKDAITACDIKGRLSCHSLRKTLGYWSKMIHPDDPNALEIIQSIFNHSDTSITLKYIGISEERKRKYFEDFGDMLKNVENGNTEVLINNSPVISIRYDSIRDIIKEIIQSDDTDINKFNNAMNMIETNKIKFI